jgi:hypothetical protein
VFLRNPSNYFWLKRYAIKAITTTTTTTTIIIVWLFLAGIGALAAEPIGEDGGIAGVSGIGPGPGAAGGGIVAGPAGGLGLVGVWGFWLGSIKIVPL